VIRAVLAVALAVALFAATLPALDDARADRSATVLRTEAASLERAARSLVTGEDATSGGVPGARRRVRFRVPAATWATAGVAWVRVGGPGGDRNRVTYRVASDGGEVRTVRLRGLRVRTPGGPVRLREAGEHVLSLSLRRDGGPVVVVRRGGRARGAPRSGRPAHVPVRGRSSSAVTGPAPP
jgi:hypothetical protein